MNESSIIISVLAWTCVIVFIATSVITILALIKKIKLPDDTYLKKLFLLLVIEVIGIGIFAFKTKVEGYSSLEKEHIIITSPLHNIEYGSFDHLNIQGSFNKKNKESPISGYYQINNGEKKKLQNFRIEFGKVFNVDIPHIPSSKENLKVVVQLNSIIKDSVSFVIEP